jgi:hypothetical protein
MLEHAIDFNKNLFGEEEDNGVKLGSDFWEEEEKVSSCENDMLEAPFFVEEVKEAMLLIRLSKGLLARKGYPMQAD